MLDRHKELFVPDEIFLFESSRVAIYHYAKSIDISSNDRVQIAAFTCSAVTDAITPLNCKISFYDCGRDLKSNNFKLEEDTKLLICQVTFGICALKKKALEEAEARGVYILIDSSLSYSIDAFEKKMVNKYPKVISLEASKAVTIGWGGVLTVPESKISEFQDYFKNLKSVSLVNDVGRVISSLVNFYMIRNGGYVSFCIWAFLRIINFHRLSKYSSHKKYRVRSIMGPISKRVFLVIFPKIAKLLRRSNYNHDKLKKALEDIGLVVVSHVDDSISSARVAFLLDESLHQSFREVFSFGKVEIGQWFSSFPTNHREFKTNQFPGCVYIHKTILNLPCHWTLSEKELDAIITLLGNFRSQNQKC